MSCIQDRLRSIILNRFNVRFIFFPLIFLILYFLSEHLGSEIFLNKEVLKLLVSIEATILGFYGLMFTYMLNALDTRQKRYEDQQSGIELVSAERNGLQGRFSQFDPEQQKRLRELYRPQEEEREHEIRKQIAHFKNRKKYIGKTFIITFGALVLSMLIALLLISLIEEWGITVNELIKLLSVSLIALFINSFIFILLLIYEISQGSKFLK